MPLFTVRNQLPSMLVSGVLEDGQTTIQFNIQDYAKGAYLLVFFFPLGLKEDPSEVLNNFLSSLTLSELQKLNFKVVGVTSESPLAIKRWMVKARESGGFGNVQLGFPIVSDEDHKLSMSMKPKGCGVPSRSAFIFDPRGFSRYCFYGKFYGKSRISRGVLRLVNAVKKSDRKGRSVPASWRSGEDGLGYEADTEADTNKDGKINVTEFSSLIAKLNVKDMPQEKS